MLQRHLKRNYERELIIAPNGTISHNSCIDHCLLFAFGECTEKHYIRCEGCKEFFDFFDDLKLLLDSGIQEQLIEIQEKLKYYLAHQTRKVYLNAQYKMILGQLDQEGAILICDYKMRILPRSARETKEEFFGKRGWTLHTILVLTLATEDNSLEISAFDHWSTDTKQDAWFTLSSFDAVFETLSIRPKWIRVISDNGGHYHNSELMATIAHWNVWYQIEVRSWLFLEPGEAKTIIDSHHAAVSN